MEGPSEGLITGEQCAAIRLEERRYPNGGKIHPAAINGGILSGVRYDGSTRYDIDEGE